MTQPQEQGFAKEETLPFRIKDGAESSDGASATGSGEAVLPYRVKEEGECSETASVTEDEAALKEDLPSRIKEGGECLEGTSVTEDESASKEALLVKVEASSKEASPVRDEASSTAAAASKYYLWEEARALNLKEQNWTEEDEYPPDEPEETEEPVDGEEYYLGPRTPELAATLNDLRSKVDMFYNDMVIVREHLKLHTRRIGTLREELAVGVKKMREVQEGMKKLAEELGLKDLHPVDPKLTDVVLDLWVIMDTAKHLAQFDYEGPEREMEMWEFRKEEHLREERKARDMALWLKKRYKD